MDAAAELETHCGKMIYEEITTQEIKSSLETIKAGKAAGSDGLKPKLFRANLKSEVCIESLRGSLNLILRSGKTPETWKESSTIMIPKVKKPEAKNLRSTSLTNISHKIFMKVIRERIYEHLRNNNEEKEEQTGFTTGKRIEANLYILQYCIRNSYERSKTAKHSSNRFQKNF